MIKDTNEAVRVLVVDDSAFMRKVITDILNSDEEIKVIDTARNGAEAIEKAKLHKPDVITLDVEMPVMDGLACLKQLIKQDQTPVIMLSSVTKEGADVTIQALENGAIDFITKPTNIFSMLGEDKMRELIEKVKVAKKAKQKNIFIYKSFKNTIIHNVKPKNEVKKSSTIKKIVAIGTSTGGPKALQAVIPLIPGDIPAAFLVVQHMPPGFTRSLADRLNGMSEVTVKEAEDNEIISAGCVYIAPGDYHMRVERYEQGGNLKIKLTREPPLGGHRPAVNVMMESLSDTGFTNIIGVIMTGMGGDGSEGIKKLKEKNNAFIIAQDEKSCVVYGMPKVAVQTGVVDTIVPLKEITKEIVKILGVYK